MVSNDFCRLYQFDLVEPDFPVAVATLKDAFVLVEHMEACLHRFVVGDTLMVIALDDAYQFVGHAHFAFFHHFIVLDDAQGGIGRDDRQLIEFLI